MIYILFGPPGVGKTYIGGLIRDSLGYRFFDADSLISRRERELIKSGNYRQSDRDKFIKKLKQTTERLLREGKEDLVIAEAFTKDKNRVDYINQFKQAKFILVEAPMPVAEKRMRSRMRIEGHVIDKNSFERFWKGFDKPSLPYCVIKNYNVSDDKIMSDFNLII